MAARGVSSEGQAPPGPAPGRLSGPWEGSVRGGWTGGSGGPAQLPQCQPVPPRRLLPGYWAPLGPQGGRGAGQGPYGGRAGAGTRCSLSLDIRDGPATPSRPGLGAGTPGPLGHRSRPVKANPWGGGRWGPRALPSQATPQQARVESLLWWRVPVPAARSQQWSDKKDKVGE